MASFKCVIVLLVALLGIAAAFPYAFPDVGYDIKKPVYHPHPVKGRVKMQVYRGPNKDKVGYEYFAPWGYYVTQPEDLKHVGYH